MASYVGEIKDGVLKKYTGAPPAKLRVTTKATKIGNGAFKAKQGLTDVILHEAVTEVGDSAFESCKKLKKVCFPQSVKRIGYASFANCRQLNDVVLPDSLDAIGAFAFFDTGWLNNQTESVYAGGFLLRAAKDAVAYEIEPGTRGIVGGAFANCTSITSVSIPDSVHFIGDNAFSGGYYADVRGCEALTEIAIPDSIETIGKDAFTGCYSLRKISISEEEVRRLGDKAIEQAFFAIPEMRWNDKDAFLRSMPMRFLSGEQIDLGELHESLCACLRKKDVRTRLIGYYLENDEPEALGRLLSVQNKLPLEEIEGYFAISEQKKFVQCTAVLLEYRNRVLSDRDTELRL